MTENIKSQSSSKKEDQKINKPSDVEVLLSENKKVSRIHLRNLKTVDPLNLKNEFLDLDEGSFSVRNAPSRKNGERVEVQFESLPVFQVFCEKYNRFKNAGFYLQEAVVSRQNSRGGLLNQEDVKKITNDLEARIKSFEGKLKDLENEYPSDFVMPEIKNYRSVCSQNGFIANHFIEQANKADRIICSLDYLYSKGKLGFLSKGIQVRNRVTTVITQLLSEYMDELIRLEEGVRGIRQKRQRERDQEAKRLQRQKEEAERQAQRQKRLNQQENDKAKKEKAEMRATAKVYKRDENGRMVLVEEVAEKASQIPDQASPADKAEQPKQELEPKPNVPETVEQAQAQTTDEVLPEQAETLAVSEKQTDQVQPVETVVQETPAQAEVESKPEEVASTPVPAQA